MPRMKPSDRVLTDARAAIGPGARLSIEEGDVRLETPHAAASNVYSAEPGVPPDASTPPGTVPDPQT